LVKCDCCDAQKQELAIGKRVKDFRKLSGLTQENLGQKASRFGVNLTQNMIAKIELGNRPISLAEFIALGKVLGHGFLLLVQGDFDE
jgi:transcriptional regulator with XRE-family HTH domain